MFDILQNSTVSVAVQDNPFLDEKTVRQIEAGATVAEIVRDAGIPDDLKLRYHVTIGHGARAATIPMDQWGRVRPKAGSLVSIHPKPGDPGSLVAILTSVVSAAAPAMASWLFPAAGAFGLGLATAAITVVGALAVRALIPPPSTERGQAQDDPNYSLTGQANVPNPYGVLPTVFGRHQMFFPPMTSGYTESAGEDILFRGRYTLGHVGQGTVALETLKIGDTSVLEFDDVELEFRNVDQTETEAMITGIGAKTVAWRSGSDVMELYPDNIFEEPLNIELEEAVDNIRTTQLNTREISVDLSFNGLYRVSGNDGKRKSSWVEFDIFYRPVGAGTWTQVESNYRVTGSTTAFFRKTISWTPSEGAGQYDVRVVRVADSGDSNPVNDSFWSAIRSVRAGTLPSDPDIAEVCIKVRASQQLSGRLDTFNGIVWKMVPIWDGSAWTAPQKTRHPAWAFAHALKGPMLRSPQPDSKIDLADLKAFADEEPHWTCDLVIDQPMTVNEVLQTIAATGRATRHMKNLKHTVLRDGADGPVVAHFTPRNTFGFEGNLIYYKEIHGFHVEVLSEQLDWQYDRITVYADGYDANNATEFETLRLTGVVIKNGDVDQGNAYRLARYHLAQVFLRPEAFTFSTALDHVRLVRGDKIRFVHDVPLIGLGSGRIKALTATTITLDETLDVSGAARLIVRQSDGEELILSTSTTGETDTFTVTDSTGASAGDLVQVELTAVESMVLMVTRVEPQPDMTANIECVPAAPAVLTADSGTIPNYNPSLTTPNALSAKFGPARPTVLGVYSDNTTVYQLSDGTKVPRIAVAIETPTPLGNAATTMQVRWRGDSTGNEWEAGEPAPISPSNRYLTGVLQEGVEYDVQVRSIDAMGRSLGWVSAGTMVATTADIVPPDVAGFTHTVDKLGVLLSWEPSYIADIRLYQIRYDLDGLQGWANSEIIAEAFHPSVNELLPVKAGTYRIKAVDWTGQESANDASTTVTQAEFDSVQDIFADVIDGLAQEAFSNFDASFQAALDRTEEGVMRALVDEYLETARVEGVIEENRTQQQSEIDGINATLTQDYLTAAATNGALAQLETDLTASINGVQANVNTVSTALATTDAAVASLQTSLTSEIAGVEAWATQTFRTEAQVGQAISDAVTVVATDLDGLETTVTQVQSSVNGIEGVYGVQINNNGVVSGFGLISSLVDGSPVSDFIVDVDNFFVGTTDTSGDFSAPFVVTGGEVYLRKARIKDADIDTLKVAGNAITLPTESDGGLLVGSGFVDNAVTDVVQIPAGITGNIRIFWAIQHGYGAGARFHGWRLKVNGSVVDSRGTFSGSPLQVTNGPQDISDYIQGQYTAFNQTGNVSIVLEWGGEDSGISVQASRLTCFLAKR